MLKTFAAKWAEFEDLALPANTDRDIRRRTREIFYSGGWALISCILDNAKSPNAVEQTSVLFEEFKTFYRAMQVLASERTESEAPPPG